MFNGIGRAAMIVLHTVFAVQGQSVVAVGMKRKRCWYNSIVSIRPGAPAEFKFPLNEGVRVAVIHGGSSARVLKVARATRTDGFVDYHAREEAFEASNGTSGRPQFSPRGTRIPPVVPVRNGIV
jgi:hypothetical protein